ncbi:hypothetical protein [Streptomyces carpinensis]|uniref:hypothetical protein n=1 Tax=Streptomyces carpinensis TaxID=66369 RepID=UPI00142DFDA0|nr:hypothetical protein [Streptomyces carpinensis]
MPISSSASWTRPARSCTKGATRTPLAQLNSGASIGFAYATLTVAAREHPGAPL